MINFEVAKKIILENTTTIKDVEKVPLTSSLDRILAEDVFSDMESPPFSKSAMDGFAVKSSDLKKTPAKLEVIMDIPAGKSPAGEIRPGTCASIMTGAEIPKGADTVVMVESTSGFGDDNVTVNKVQGKGANVIFQGELLKNGQKVLSGGVKIGSEEIALLAMCGYDPVPVFRRLKVAVLSTGDEIVSPDCKPGPSQIRNSNGPALLSFVSSLGHEAVFLGQVKDSKKALEEAITRGLGYDCLLVSGGISMGKYDFVEEIFERSGVSFHMKKVAVKPGKPTVFGTKGQNIVFGMPGYPVSSLTIARVLVQPALEKKMGATASSLKTIKAVLEKDFTKKKDRMWLIPACLTVGENISVNPLKGRGSADLLTYSKLNCLVIAPMGISNIKKGSCVDVIIWDRFL